MTRRLALIPLLILLMLAGVLGLPSPASADTGSDDVSIMQEFTTHYVGDFSHVDLGLEDASTSCFAFGNCDTPTGTVTMTLTDPNTGQTLGVASGPVTPDPNSNATSTADILWYVGGNAMTYAVSYAYSGDGQFAPATQTGYLTSSKIPTTATLTQSSYQTYAGQVVAFTVHVSSTVYDPYQLGGMAQLWYGVNPFGSPFPVTSGVGTYTTTSLPVSDNTGRTYYVRYLGDGQHEASETNNVDHRTLATIATSVTLDVPTPVWLSDPISITAHVSAADGTKQPGAISFLAWMPLPGGQRYLAYNSSTVVDARGTVHVSWPAGALDRGDYTIEATYGPADQAYAAGDATAPLTIVAGGTPQPGATVTATASPDPGTPGGSTTLTATVGTAGAPDATGTVRFLVDGTSVGTCTLASRTCALTTTTPAAGMHAIRAHYLGDAHWQPANGDTTLDVRAMGSGKGGASPRRAPAGAKVTLHVLMHRADGTPATGRVTFREGGGLVGAARLDGTGSARLGTTALPVGDDTVIATYSGDARTAPRTLSIPVTILAS